MQSTVVLIKMFRNPEIQILKGLTQQMPAMEEQLPYSIASIGWKATLGMDAMDLLFVPIVR